MKSFYIYTVEQKIGLLPGYLYPIISLVQGLKKLGFSVYSNKNYWLQFPDFNYLIKNDKNINPEDCDYVIIPCQYFSYGYKLPLNLFKKDRKHKNILIDTCDGFLTSGSFEYGNKFDLIFKNINRFENYNSEITKPWAYGVTEELIRVTKNIHITNQKKLICVNYRNSHGVRNSAEKYLFSKISKKITIDRLIESFIPQKLIENLNECKTENELLFYQSGFRHHPAYLQRISESIFTACFGGEFFFRNTFDKGKLSYKIGSYLIKNRSTGRINTILNKMNIQRDHMYSIYQWDSYRLWEAWLTGSIVIHCDFDKYGVQMPVMPLNDVHYVGIDLLNYADSENKIFNAMEKHKTIQSDALAFVIDNYSPLPVAKRFLDHLKITYDHELGKK